MPDRLPRLSELPGFLVKPPRGTPEYRDFLDAVFCDKQANAELALLLRRPTQQHSQPTTSTSQSLKVS